MRFIHFFILVFLFSSCATMYRTNKVNVPLFKEKGEFQGEITVGSGGPEIQLAYALTENLAFMANGVYNSSTASAIDTIYGVKDASSNYRNSYAEGGIGYYKALNKDTTLSFNVFLGGGYGTTTGFNDVWNAGLFGYKASYYRMFWQPSVGIIQPKYELSGALRFNFLNYQNLNVIGYKTFKSRGSDIFLEPVITLKAGSGQLKFLFQAGASIPFKKTDYYNYTPLILSVGFHMNFTRYWEKTEETDIVE